MTAFYNEIDPVAAQWLRNLIAAGHIAPGVVDERSIADIQLHDLIGYTQCHFFAGIGVWSLALRRAGWPDDRPVWTGSCPCQPFSAAGKGAGFDDERHLWPEFARLIAQYRPPAVLGEQVASKDADPWVDLVHNDLEAMGYAFGAVPFPSAGVGAPHIRDRLYWVAHADSSAGRQGRADSRGWADRGDAQPRAGLGGSSLFGGMAHARLEGRGERAGGRAVECAAGARGVVGGVGHTSGERQGAQRITLGGPQSEPDRGGVVGGVADDLLQQRPHGQPEIRDEYDATGWLEGAAAPAGLRSDSGRPGPTNGFWQSADWLLCRDGRWRPVEPGYEQMADGSAASLGRVCAADIEEITEEISDWSIRHQTDAGEALRRVWSDLQSEAICEREAGRFSGVQSPAVLLAFLRQLTDQGWRFSFCLPCSSTEASSRVVRVMQFDASAARTPLRRELAEQLAGQPADSVRELSSIVAHHAALCWGEACRAKASAASFPLTRDAASRVARLRAYGNAINAEAARVFIECVMDVN